jgi:endonuclease/exonuclease/phosphatase family metal-dependent hydrolase
LGAALPGVQMYCSIARLVIVLMVIASGGCASSPRLRALAQPDAWPCRVLVGDAAPVDGLAERMTWIDADEASSTALAESCATVGPSVLAKPGGQRPASVEPAEQLAIVSWNMHADGGDLTALVSALRSGVATRGRAAAHVVVLVQEAFRSGWDVPQVLPPGVRVPRRIATRPEGIGRLGVVAAAREAGLHLFYVPSMRNGADAGGPAEDRGNAILSTLPLSELTAIELPYARQRRVAVSAVISGARRDGEAWRLRVVSAHLDATAGASSLWLFSSGLRERQAAHLLSAIDDDIPTVIGSDLNTWAGGPGEPAVRVLRQAFPGHGKPDRATFRFGWTLDYLFTRLPESWQGELRTLVDRYGSDHHPLVAWVRIGSGA